jgi:DNA mismatch endonuclease (patch repair protein)
MADVLSSEQRSYNMSRIRGRDTGPEMALRRQLWKMGFRYRVHYKLPGRPDVVFVSRRIAIFVDGCFWHGCPHHGVRPKTNSLFWAKKIQGTIDRDTRNRELLEHTGWIVMRFWEHDVEKNLAGIMKKLKKLLE